MKTSILLALMCVLCSGCSSDVVTEKIFGIKSAPPTIINYDVDSDGYTVEIVRTENGELQRNRISGVEKFERKK